MGDDQSTVCCELAWMDLHLLQCRARLRDQEASVAALARHGRATFRAKQHLKTIKMIQQQLARHRRLLAKELAATDSRNGTT